MFCEMPIDYGYFVGDGPEPSRLSQIVAVSLTRPASEFSQPSATNHTKFG